VKNPGLILEVRLMEQGWQQTPIIYYWICTEWK